jgi:hypothetical protein
MNAPVSAASFTPNSISTPSGRSEPSRKTRSVQGALEGAGRLDRAVAAGDQPGAGRPLHRLDRDHGPVIGLELDQTVHDTPVVRLRWAAPL